MAFDTNGLNTGVILAQPLPAGTNLIGGVNLAQVGGASFGLGVQTRAAGLGVAATEDNSYSCGAVFTVATAATDIFAISGSASQVVRVRLVRVTGVQTTGSSATIQLIKRSAVNTGGTIVNPPIVKMDTNNPAPTSVISEYTANPASLGTSVGIIRVHIQPIPASGGGTADVPFQFGIYEDQPVVLRGVAESLCINLNGGTFVGNSIAVSVEWTESAT